jgi:hypothetical protein
MIVIDQPDALMDVPVAKVRVTSFYCPGDREREKADINRVSRKDFDL